MQKEKKTNIAVTFALVALGLLLGSVVSFCVGKYPISVREIVTLLTGGEVSTMTHKVFFTLRVPRTLMAVLGGMGLGLAGAVYQNIFKNPLASPDIIGISSGANMGAAIAIVSAGGTMVSIAVGAFGGGLAAVLLVMILVQSTRSNSTSTYVLAGIIISALANTVIMLLKYYADSESQLAAIEYWTMGSLASITASKVWAILPFWIVGFSGLLMLHRQVGLMSLNEEECRALGVRLKQVRIVVLLLSTLLVASVICVTGLISFAGLIAPHIARMMIRRQNSQTLVLSSLVGSGVLLISDILARTLYAAELPISILTTVIGVPILVWFMCKQKGGVV